ncbi:NAD(P)-dependent oxidoreductase [bacterium]|nr:NAD(P)-dependent oxidoreductase [bacterium]
MTKTIVLTGGCGFIGHHFAEHIHKNYGIDVRTYSSYEIGKNNFDVVKVFPFVDQNNQKISDEYCYMALLEQNKTQALWINLKKFEDGLGKKAISWYNKNTSPFFVEKVIRGDDHKKRAATARVGLSDINIENFWPDKNCDIEQFVYMMPIGHITSLYDAIWRKDLFLIKETKSKFASQLYLRFLMNNADVDQVENQIKEYAKYRYGGKLKTDKENFDAKYQEGVYSESFHTTYNELLAQIDELSKKPENAHLMKQLKKFYDSSIITSLAEDDLSVINRVKIDEKN